MADQTYLPGNILSLASAAADRLMQAGSGDAALLYLHLLKTGGVYHAAEAARALKWEMGRCDAAQSLLVGLGLSQPQTEAPAPEPQAEPPEYTAEDINRELADHASAFPSLVTEVQRRLGKVLSTNDLKSLYTIYDFTGLPAEVILMVVSWTVEEYRRKYGQSRMPRMPQIQREAHVKRLSLLRDRSVRILALLDIRDRQPVTREKEYITGWVDMGFEDEAIRMAYEKTVLKKRTLNWSYMDGILKNWHQQGLHTVEEVRRLDTQPPRRAVSTPAGATAPQPTRHGEADRRAREDMERMRKLLEKEKKGGT